MELEDIQGIVLSGYGALPHASFLPFRFADPREGRKWVGMLAGQLAAAGGGPPQAGVRAQLAFTYAGLLALGLSWQALKGFPREFQEGMAGNERRSRILGDVDASAPEHWDWGGPKRPPIDGVLLLYADRAESLAALEAQHGEAMREHAVQVLLRLPTRSLPDGKEHFGFRDGISQPKISGISQSEDLAQRIEAGEFVLGYPNERGEYTMRPLVDPIEDPDGLLPADVSGSDQRDFGRNGSYLVFRQLSQDVFAFWDFVDRATRTADGAAVPEDRVRLAAKMVGRWPGGAPLVKSPDKDEHALQSDNAFLYQDADPLGVACPIGAHIRRTNPRDSLPPRPGSPGSLALNRRHRLLRRGRSYGEPLAPSMDPEDVLRRGRPGAPAGDRGLHFLCFNASIPRQFEFVQHTWVNNPSFAGLQSGTDPVIGERRGAGGLFVVQAEPVRQRHCGLPRAVEVKGGAYFFMPGLRALRFLAREPLALASAYSAPAPTAWTRPASASLRRARRVHRWIERGLGALLRGSRAGGALGRGLRARIEAGVQGMLRRRRARKGADRALALAEERLVPDEAALVQRLAETRTQLLFKEQRRPRTRGREPADSCALLRGVFEIEPGLEPALQVGVFGRARSYEAWIRLGRCAALLPADAGAALRSIEVKLLGVPGPKLLDDALQSQDFSAISAPTFPTPGVIEALRLEQHRLDEIPLFYFANPFDSHVLDAVMQALHSGSGASPLATRYWSCLPCLFGAGRAVQYSFVPQASEAPAGTAAFDFLVQFQTDAARMPIEDASVAWDSPYLKLATLRMAAHDGQAKQGGALPGELSFNPWHALAEHRPLGSLNRARRRADVELARVRRAIEARAPGRTR